DDGQGEAVARRGDGLGGPSECGISRCECHTASRQWSPHGRDRTGARRRVENRQRISGLKRAGGGPMKIMVAALLLATAAFAFAAEERTAMKYDLGVENPKWKFVAGPWVRRAPRRGPGPAPTPP